MFINMSSYAEITKSTETNFSVSIGIGSRFNIHCCIIFLLNNSLYHRSYIFSRLLLLLVYFFGINLFHALYLSHIWFLHILCDHLSLLSKCWFFHRMIQGVILLLLNFLWDFWFFNFRLNWVRISSRTKDLCGLWMGTALTFLPGPSSLPFLDDSFLLAALCCRF